MSDMLARMGGDEFAIITDHMEQPEDTSVIAKKLIESLSFPLMINEHRIKISPSIGIALYPDSGETVSNLLSNADIALYKAKNEGKNTFCYFTKELNTQSYAQIKIENALYNALEQQDFYCCYQPIMNIDTKTLFGMELLLQSENPVLKKITIKNIIDMANKTGLIIPLGHWMLEKAFQQLSEWREQGRNFKLSINLSAQQLEYESWLKTVNSFIKKYQVDSHSLILNLMNLMFHLIWIILTNNFAF